MPHELEEVQLTPYPAVEAIPPGFKVAGEFKTRRAPSPMQFNWYSRHDSVQHEVFHKLATALTKKPQGYTVEELKAQYDKNADKAKVDQIINKFKGSWDHRHTGFDLVVDETGTRYMLIWRDPRVHYAKEIGLRGDHSAVPHQKTPSYVEKVPGLIKARNSQAFIDKALKAPRSGSEPKSTKTSKAPGADGGDSAPSGGHLTLGADGPVKPWVGLSVLVLGESSYTKPENRGKPLPPDWNQSIIRDFLKDPFQRDFRTIKWMVDVFYHTPPIDCEEHRKFWQRTSFANFVQADMGNADTRPRKGEWLGGQRAFQQYLRQLQPLFVLAVGFEAYESLPEGGQAHNFATEPPSSGKTAKKRPCLIYDDYTFVCGIMHTAARGFKLKIWRAWVKASLEEARKFHQRRNDSEKQL